MPIANPQSHSYDKRSTILIDFVLAAAVLAVASLTGQKRQAAPHSTKAPPLHRHRDASRHAAARADGRGRSADKPSDIPARGWKDVLLRVYREIADDRVLAIAAGVTFYGLLALFPAIAATVSLYGLFADPATINGHLAAMGEVLPAGAVEIVGDQVKRVASTGDGKLGLAFALGLALAIWSANGGMKAIFDALNVVYDEKEKRGFLRLNLTSLAFTAGAVLFVLVALGAMVGVPILLENLWFGKTLEWLVWIARWPAVLVALMLGLALLYRFGPSRDKARWRWITPGSVLAALLWLGASMLFSWYAANFGSYNKTYGSLGAVIGFMTWMWISGIVILLGAELNAELEHQTARDTTEGPEQPLGWRGARVADEVAPAGT
jgi:membrane protein